MLTSLFTYLQKSSHILFIGIMLFALFFGAGNLIFPVMLGQLAGQHVTLASSGFVITGVMLPLLGVIALGFSGLGDFLKVSQRAGLLFGIIFATVLYLTIGPLFAMPRTGSVSYEIAIKPFVDPAQNTLGLLLFSIVYFTLCCLLSINPNRVVDIVGKILTPIMLLFIVLLVIVAVLNPMGDNLDAITPEYQTHPFFTGFTNGYLTMDTLASFIFGIIVIQSIRNHGITDKKEIMYVCIKSSLIAATILAFVYISLAYIGSHSVARLGILENGGQVLARVSTYYFGIWGNVILGIIVTMACVTTSIGLTIACANYFQHLIPRFTYQFYAILFSLVSALFANVGLSDLISFSVPLLSIIYPVTIVLIALTFLHRYFKGHQAVYIGSLYCTLLVSLFDGLAMTPFSIDCVNTLLKAYLPLYSVGLGWLLPALVGFAGGYLYSLKAVSHSAK